MLFLLPPDLATQTAISVFLGKTKNLDKSGCVRAIFLDLKRAVDRVDHNILLTKLTHFNFSEQALKWMISQQSEAVEEEVCCGQQCQIPLPKVPCGGPARLHTWTSSFLALYKRSS